MTEAKRRGPQGTPDFIDILSIDDKISYENLQKKVSSPKYRYNHNQRISTMIELFDQIREYCEQTETDKWKRYVVCGICWFNDYLAINTRQLRFLISKSKSSINDVLSKMGYKTVSVKGEPGSLLFENIPFLFGNQIEFRKWSIRKIENDNKNNNKKAIKTIQFISDVEDCCKCDTDDADFYNDFCQNEQPNKNETEDEFEFVNFGDKVDENFDFNFGYFDDDESCFEKCCNSFSFDNNKELVIDNNVLNCKFEGSTKVY